MQLRTCRYPARAALPLGLLPDIGSNRENSFMQHNGRAGVQRGMRGWVSICALWGSDNGAVICHKWGWFSGMPPYGGDLAYNFHTNRAEKAPCVAEQFESELFGPMTRDEFALHYHETKLELELFKRTGKAFQDFFELIMQKADSSFIMIKPMGREGDWKADGFSANSGTVYQCYAPENMTGAEAARKIVEDFCGAKDRWHTKMQSWVFVWSSQRALPPQACAALECLEADHATVKISHMGRAGLWSIVRKLPRGDREAFLGIVPDLIDAPMTTAAEIQVLLKHIGRLGVTASDSADFDLTAIADKLRKNHFSDAMTSWVKPALPVAKLVEKFITSMPDPCFSEVIAADLAKRYAELAALAENSEVIFGGLIQYVLGEHHLQPKFFWAAAGIVTHYFELCDIFEH